MMNVCTWFRVIVVNISQKSQLRERNLAALSPFSEGVNYEALWEC